MYEQLEQDMDYHFHDPGLLSIAFTHSSYAHENHIDPIHNNERLEYLGDAVLELTISDYLYRHFPKLTEGELTRFRASLVCESSLSMLARKIQAGKHLMLGKGEEASGGKERDSILADVLEAIIGAVYLDGGPEKSGEFIQHLFGGEIERLKDGYRFSDYKTYLQESIQKHSKTPVTYEIVKEEGPAHNKTFTAHVMHERSIMGRGAGKSKKEAEQNAAHAAINKMRGRG